MNSNNLIKLAENKYNRLLSIFLLLLVSTALPDRLVLLKTAALILFLIAMLFIVYQIRARTRWSKIYFCLILSALTLLLLQVLNVFNTAMFHHGRTLIEGILLIVVSLPIFLIQQDIASTRKVTADTLKGGIAIYLMLGLAWSVLYHLLYQFEPNAFNGILPGQSEADFLHFSFVTLTTVGFGDIHPLLAPARIATVFEAITGVMYPTILISRLVSLHNTNSQEVR